MRYNYFCLAVYAYIVNLTYRYDGTASDVLLSVKKMEESLKRLKSRKTNSNLVGNMSDDDKIRLQISLDFEHLCTQVSADLVCFLSQTFQYLRLISLISYYNCYCFSALKWTKSIGNQNRPITMAAIPT